MSKRGQAALEFLMTYGWAILIVLIAIGALAYFGVLNPQRLLPKSCTVVPGISCDDFIVTAGGTGTVILRNGGAKALNSWKLNVETVAGTCTAIGWSGTDWPTGEQLSCAFTGLTSGVKGDGYSEDLIFNYTDKGSTIAHSVRGQIATRYE
ncbi:MAG TPA: hypothetical protein VJB87_04855 [Candidatus Nanoarchaeia archaeon]|nr:hypothetical protein [Candidatus Nanoarchaeia archaeon]